MIKTRGLTKRYGALTAVDGLDLDVREGDVYGFLGANGSGKTTTVRMLLGLVLATSGDIEVRRRGDARRRRARAAAGRRTRRGPAAYGHLSGRTNLMLLDASGGGSSRSTRKRRVGEALEQCRLVGRRATASQGVLARHAPAPGARGRAAAGATAARARRADERPGPPRHPRDS
ncbi:MAG: ATP-binding cassette domain-containing protein [Nocardioidaceae bacterium]